MRLTGSFSHSFQPGDSGMSKLPRSLLLPFLLTIVALLAAMHLGIAAVKVPRAEAQTCPNSECHGWAMCRYSPRVSCALYTRDGPCLASRCP
jgi:hypothetical protein